ncbi:PREDICTED: uncharacterized protein LOC105143425 isoform X2 [Acromyrmex echinatior]|uniref:uncharacterized protein LOC105143425 isoform X2 n=1 Tax=Acromyrmex echinatior TaxID=103372 RepID=UPI00058105D9|nr:PREDICTED: uncharacterized protein LOC105143425 isoform X2 [Acromyrmex echinatior]
MFLEGCAVQGWTTHLRKRMYVLSICDSIRGSPVRTCCVRYLTLDRTNFTGNCEGLQVEIRKLMEGFHPLRTTY